MQFHENFQFYHSGSLRVFLPVEFYVKSNVCTCIIVQCLNKHGQSSTSRKILKDANLHNIDLTKFFLYISGKRKFGLCTQKNIEL